MIAFPHLREKNPFRGEIWNIFDGNKKVFKVNTRWSNEICIKDPYQGLKMLLKLIKKLRNGKIDFSLQLDWKWNRLDIFILIEPNFKHNNCFELPLNWRNFGLHRVVIEFRKGCSGPSHISVLDKWFLNKVVHIADESPRIRKKMGFAFKTVPNAHCMQDNWSICLNNSEYLCS